MRTAVAAAVLVCAAAAAPAQDLDAETRFHRAYEHEVVDGKVADAAREYLAMMEDAKFPDRLRQEAKFRFAVTATLLGRADEARVHFAALAADATAPETLRARAGEYLDAAKGVGVGNELDKKLQSLVFDLAKDKGDVPVPPAYREFEVIGKRALPFLRQLLQHEDTALRTHAFRLLLRMREPNMADAWTPALTPDGWSQMDLNAYLKDRSEDRAAFERRLLGFDDETLASALDRLSYVRPAYSAETLRAFAARKVPPPVLLAVFPSGWTVETDRVRGEWTQSDDAALSAEATLSYLRFARSLGPSVAVRVDLYPTIVARLETLPLKWRPDQWQGTNQDNARFPFDGLLRVASMVPADTLLDTLGAVVDRAIAAQRTEANPLHSGLAETLAMAVERRAPEAPLPERYGEILRKWLPEASKRSIPVFGTLYQRVLAGTSRMPDGPATALAVWAVTTPWPGVPGGGAYMIPTRRPRDIPIAMRAFRAADGATRMALVRSMPIMNSNSVEDLQADYASAVQIVLAEIVRSLIASGSPDWSLPLQKFIAYERLLPAEEARERFVEMAEAVAEVRDVSQRPRALGQYLLGVDAPSTEDRSAYWTEVALPALERVWPKLAEGDPGPMMSTVLQLLVKGPRDAALRAAIAKFVAARYGEVPEYAAQYLATAPDVFPLTEWVPKVCPNSGVGNNSARVPSERADPVVRELTADPAAVNMAVLKFMDMSASQEMKTEVMDRLLRTSAMDQLQMVSFFAGRASAEALEEALRRVLAEKAPDVTVVSRLVGRLQTVRPSEAMLPGVRLLLASGKPEHLAKGVATAKSLGREELLPDLAGLLDSMDPNVRDSAKDAIDAIVALRKLKEEARRGAR